MTYEYDELNRMKLVRQLGTTPVAEYFWDGLNRARLLNYGNGASMATTYEVDNDIDLITHQFSGSSVTFDYEYDDVNRRILESVSDPQFMYSFSGPDQTTAYTPNVLNQYDSVGGTTVQWDFDGNLSTIGTDSFPHDVEGRLQSAATGLGSATYTYDPFGRRMTKVSGGSTTRYVRSQEQVIAEYDDSDQLLRRYIYGIQLDRPILMTTLGQSYYYHFDEGGSVVALSNGSGGIAEVYTYSPFGRSNGTSAVGNSIRFSGRELDPETGFYYFRKRYYDPQFGRFLEPDPIGYEDSANLYEYVGNNPLNWRDPFGLSRYQSSGFGLGDGVTLPFDQASFGVAGGAGPAGGVNVTFDVSDPSSPQIQEVLLFGGLGVGGRASGQAVAGRTFGDGEPATLGFGTMLGGGVFGVGGNLDTRIGLSSSSVEITPSGGVVFGGFACFCASVRIGQGPLLNAAQAFQRGAAAAVNPNGPSYLFVPAP